MLLMMNLDSTVWIVAGNADGSGEQNGRLAMHKFCTALNKEKDFILIDQSVNLLPRHIHEENLLNIPSYQSGYFKEVNSSTFDSPFLINYQYVRGVPPPFSYLPDQLRFPAYQLKLDSTNHHHTAKRHMNTPF